jgi:alpha-galactosidase
MRRPPLSALAVAFVICLFPGGVLLRGDDVLIENDGAFVSQDGSLWTIGNHGVRYTLGRSGNNVGVRAIADPLSDRDWHRGEGPDAFVTVNGQRVDIGSSLTQFLDATVSEHWGGVRLNLRYRLPSAAMEITRSYVVYPGSPVIETWSSYQVTGSRAVNLSDLNAYRLLIEAGRLRWITGLHTDDDRGGPFTVNEDDLDDGQTFGVGSGGRASENNVPFFSVRSGEKQFFGAMLWAGSWSLKVRRQGEDVDVQLGLPSFTTSVDPGGTLEAPHAIFGITNVFTPDTGTALQSFIEKGLRHGRPFASYVSYNTWYAYGTHFDEASVLAEMNAAAAIGVEQFVVDAGWWAGANQDDPGDFFKDWGTWTPDPDRFPNGLGALSDRAHELGMRFGIWVEPERVALSTVGQDGLARERFLAMENGGYQPGVANRDAQSAQICLADPGAREWVKSKLFAFIDETRPDYLLWDNNFSITCMRSGHGHGAQDGPFRHVRGMQSILEQVRDAYPNLEIENCAGGGNRLSLDMLAYSDTGWLDDHTFPAVRVRHNALGLAGIFPTPYLLSFALATAEAADEMRTNDLAYVIRSRMSGTMAFSFFLRELDDVARTQLTTQVALYKRIRPILLDSASIVLGPQPVSFPDRTWSGWDVVEHVSRRTGDAVILAFDTLDSPPSTVVYPTALRQDAMYDVESADYGNLGSSSGAALMAQGIEVLASGISRGHVLILRVRARE